VADSVQPQRGQLHEIAGAIDHANVAILEGAIGPGVVAVLGGGSTSVGGKAYGRGRQAEAKERDVEDPKTDTATRPLSPRNTRRVKGVASGSVATGGDLKQNVKA
jgi:hypothetical protein